MVVTLPRWLFDAEDSVSGMTVDDTREALHVVAAVLGVPVVVTENDDWSFEDGSLRIGLGWYARRGHGSREAMALAALQLWEGPRDLVHSAPRARRRTTLLRRTPTTGPLIAAIARAQAAVELCLAFPGFREPLQAALARGIPGDVVELPRHLQWVALILRASLGEVVVPTFVVPEVVTAWQRLMEFGGREVDPLVRVIAPSPDITPLRRFERALALLLPPYLRLLNRDETERGVTASGATSGATDVDAEQISVEGLGVSSRGARGEEGQADEDAGDQHADDEHAGAEHSDDEEAGASASEDREQGLFETEHAEFIEHFLATPRAARHAFSAAEQEVEGEPRNRAESTRENNLSAASAAAEATALHAYRTRALHLAPQIEAVRALWERIIAERLTARPATSRRPLPEGDTLATDSLATIVTESLAGIERPSAFLQRISRPSRARSVGSTDYVFLVDRSASMRGYVAEAAADALLILTEALAAVERDIAHAEAVSGSDLNLDIRTSLIVYGAEAAVVKPLSHGVDDAVRRRMHAAIRAPEGSTNDSAALAAAREQLGLANRRASAAVVQRTRSEPGENERRRIVILVSDGGSNDPVAADSELKALRAANVTVYGLGLGADDIVERYAPSGRRIDDPRLLAETLALIVETELP